MISVSLSVNNFFVNVNVLYSDNTVIKINTVRLCGEGVYVIIRFYIPALSPDDCETRRRPFFFMIKLLPMNTLELTARPSPV
jgi:hypothetical protein